jgi:hypothetical protein
MNNKEPIKIFIDWGGTLVDDHELFSIISKKSNNEKAIWESPESWDMIRYIGNNNYFDQAQNTFIADCNVKKDAISVINNYRGDNGPSSKTETFILFDNKPNINIEPQKIIMQMAFKMNTEGLKVNGFYVNSDKLFLAKQHSVDIFIDDDPRIAIGLACSNIKCILLLRKWNRLFDINNLYLTYNKDKIEKIKNNLIIAENWLECDIIINQLINDLNKKKEI